MEEALKVLEKYFPGTDLGMLGTLGPSGLLMLLASLAEDPCTKETQDEELFPVMELLHIMKREADQYRAGQIDELVVRFFSLAAKLTLPRINDRNERMEKYMLSLGMINAAKASAQERAKAIATELWQADTTQKIRIGEMSDTVYRRLGTEGFAESLPDTAERIKEWIKPVAPDYARKGGRPRKTP